MADAPAAAPVAPAPAPVTTTAPGANGVTPKPGVAPAPKPSAAAPEAAPAKVKFRDPRSGQFVEVDEGEAWGLYNRGKAAQKTLATWQSEKAAKDKEWKAHEERLERLKTDDGALSDFLREMGRDPRKVGEKFVLEQIEDEKLSPEAKALKEERAKNEALERKETERTQQAEQQRYDTAKAQEADRLGNLFADALGEAGIPEKASRMFFPAMAGLYRGARAAAMQHAGQIQRETGQEVDYRTLMPEPRFFADHLRNTMKEMLTQYAGAHPDEMGELFKGYASARPLEELEGLIGEREHNGKKLKYPEIVNQRYVAALLEKRKGTPGATQPVASGGGVAVSAYDLPGETVRNMPGELQALYWKMQTAHPDEKAGIRRNFEQMARKYGVKLGT